MNTASKVLLPSLPEMRLNVAIFGTYLRSFYYLIKHCFQIFKNLSKDNLDQIGAEVIREWLGYHCFKNSYAISSTNDVQTPMNWNHGYTKGR